MAVDRTKFSLSMNWNKLKKQIRDEDKQRLQKKRDKKSQRKNLQKGNSSSHLSSMGNSSQSSQKRNYSTGTASPADKNRTSSISIGGSMGIVESIFHPEQTEKSRGPTPIVAIDCEMVQVENVFNALARISIVNYNGHVLLDTLVKPTHRVTDYRTWITGIRHKDLLNAPAFESVRAKCVDFLRGKVVVGHTVENDFKVLNYEHEEHLVRDVGKYRKYRNDVGKGIVSLKKLSLSVLGKRI